jgi:hypothetical protein
MKPADDESTVVSIEDHLLRQFDQAVTACRLDLVARLHDCTQRYDPFAVAVARADHFTEQLNTLIMGGKLTRTELTEYTTSILGRVERPTLPGSEPG